MDKNKYFDIYFEKLEKSGVSHDAVETFKEKYGEVLNNASYATKNDSGLAYDGSLIEIALTKLAVYAVKLNNLYPDTIKVDQNSIVKVALLQHISKAVRSEKSTNDWRIKNLGEIYTYVKGSPAIGTGLHSIAMCAECGIQFTPFEIEAMVSIDRDGNEDLQFKYHSNMLTSIIKNANEMVYIEAQKIKGIIQ